MPTKVGDVYEACCVALLEDSSALAGDFTGDQFIKLYLETLLDLCGKSGLAKGLFNVPFQGGVQLYDEPDELGDVLYVSGNQQYLYESSDFFLSNSDPDWQSSTGQVQFYREDSISAKQIQVDPAPLNNGTQIETANPGYGQISGTVQQRLWVFTGGPGYGQVSSASGAVAILTANAGLGIIGNVTMPPEYTVSPNGYGTLTAGNGWFFNCADFVLPETGYGIGMVWSANGLYIQSPQEGFGTFAQIPVGLTGVVQVNVSGAGYGIPSAFTPMIANVPQSCGCGCALNCVDFWVTTDVSTPAGLGTVSGALGNPYLNTLNQGFGVVGDMVPSTGNLSMIGTQLPFNIENVQLSDWIELIPDMLTPYLKYGVLAKLFSNSSESKDEQKAIYVQARFGECINSLCSILSEDYQET